VTAPAAAGVRERAPSLYDCVGRRLDAIATALGLRSQRNSLARAHRLLCAQSGAYPVGGRPPRRSALNADGTPVQLSLTLADGADSVGVLSDVAPPGLAGRQRLDAARACLHELAELLGAQGGLARIDPLLERAAPADDPRLLAEHSGALWIGTGFTPGRSPTLKVYANARWGDEHERWGRLDQLADELGVREPWRDARELLRGELEPLGLALGVRAGAPAGETPGAGDTPVVARIYLSGYGKRWERLEALARSLGGGAFAAEVGRCARALLADDDRYPSRSVVLSIGVRDRALADAKVELCGHCAFASDRQARARCEHWLADDPRARAAYVRVVELLSEGHLSDAQTTLHAYVGVGSQSERSFYFNPAPPAGDGG
jgi:hypothetical protein